MKNILRDNLKLLKKKKNQKKKTQRQGERREKWSNNISVRRHHRHRLSFVIPGRTQPPVYVYRHTPNPIHHLNDSIRWDNGWEIVLHMRRLFTAHHTHYISLVHQRRWQEGTKKKNLSHIFRNRKKINNLITMTNIVSFFFYHGSLLRNTCQLCTFNWNVPRVYRPSN